MSVMYIFSRGGGGVGEHLALSTPPRAHGRNSNLKMLSIIIDKHVLLIKYTYEKLLINMVNVLDLKQIRSNDFAEKV